MTLNICSLSLRLISSALDTVSSSYYLENGRFFQKLAASKPFDTELRRVDDIGVAFEDQIGSDAA